MDYTEAIRLSPDLGDAYYRRGVPTRRLGRQRKRNATFSEPRGKIMCSSGGCVALSWQRKGGQARLFGAIRGPVPLSPFEKENSS